MGDWNTSGLSSEVTTTWQRTCVGLIVLGLGACGAEAGPDQPGVADPSALEAAELPESCDSCEPEGDPADAGIETCPKGPDAICHEFIATDNGRNVVNYVNEFDPSKNWTSAKVGTTANSPRTIEIVPNCTAKSRKAVLVSTNTGFVELDLADGTLLRQQAGFVSVTSANRLPNKSTALGIVSNITNLDASGCTVRTIPLPEGPDLRAINRNPHGGHYWFSKRENIFEIDKQGDVLWQANMGPGTKGYAVFWRKGGGAYATTGDPATVLEIDAAGQVVSTVGGKANFPFLDFFSGFVRLPNGNFVVANWLGHITPQPDQPHLVELTPDNREVWRWGDQTLARQITSVYVFR